MVKACGVPIAAADKSCIKWRRMLLSMALVLGQCSCEAESNEIAAVSQLLHHLALEGAIVTMDAMGCQSALVQAIVAQKGEYILAVKGNQTRLHEALRDFFAMPNPP